MIAIPVLVLLLGMSQLSAQALAFAMIIAGSTIALITYSWAGQADWWVGVSLALRSLVFVPFGVPLAYRLSENKLRACFAGMLFTMVVLLVSEA